LIVVTHTSAAEPSPVVGELPVEPLDDDPLLDDPPPEDDELLRPPSVAGPSPQDDRTETSTTPNGARWLSIPRV
jgi:hypothetical protein